MATESPIRIPSHGEAATLAPSTHNMVIEDLGLHKKGQHVRGNGRDTIPNRSGSAPPNMEGSFLAINNLISPPNASLKQSIGSGTMQNSGLNKVSHNVNPNARLPTPPIPKENRHPGRHFVGIWRTSSTDNNTKSSFNTQVTLSTHKEEPEDDQSPQQPSNDLVDRTNRFWAGEDAGPLLGQSKSLVDLIQDFPRTPSPVYNQSRSLSSGTTEEPADNDGDSSSLHDYSVSASNAVASTTNRESVRLPMTTDHSASPIPSTSSLNYAVAAQTTPVNKVASNVANIAIVESGVKNLNISSLNIPKDPTSQDQWHPNHQSHLLQRQFCQQLANPFQIHPAKPQIGPQAPNSAFVGMDQYFRGTSKFSTEVQPVLQSSGFTPPLYTAAATYMTSGNPYYTNIQAPALYPSQYGTSGYPSNSGSIPPFIAGYPPNTPIPVVFDGPTAPNFSARISGPSSGANVAHGAEMQQFNKFFGHPGYAVHTSFSDPTYMSYYHHPFGQAFNVAGQFDPLMSGGVFVGSQNFPPDSKRGLEVTGVSDDQKSQSQSQRAGVGNPRNVRGMMVDPHYFNNPPNMGIMMQYPPSPLAPPVLRGSVASGAINSGVRSELRISSGTDRYPAVYSGWYGQRSAESYNDPKIYNVLEELKSGKGRRFELSDITGHIVEFSTDQHGSRFIQQKLECCSTEEKANVFKEVLPHACKLMTDVFGNYVIQKFFEYGSPDQRKELANQLTGQILPLSLQMYGCRVIQKALDVIELDQKVQLVRELDGQVIRCVRDQNGNHVIQKCIESVPAEKIGFIISAFWGQVATLSMHPYGCRVIQRVLEHCTDELHFQFIIDEILESVYALSQDQYGNYVTQHVLERGKPRERLEIINRLSGHIVQLSQHKFASNVIEKCLEYGGATEKELMIEEILGQNEGSDNLLTMMKDQFANYVVQKILDTCSDSQRLMLLNRIQPHLHALKKYTYGKHIVGRFEQQFGEDHSSS